MKTIVILFLDQILILQYIFNFFFGFECLYRVESSAYCKESQVTFSAQWNMYKFKRTGPNILPCGTPKLLSFSDELLSST